MKRYNSNLLFSENNRKTIPGTEFMGNTREEVFHSSKNTRPSAITGAVTMTLPYKFGEAIAKSQSNDFNIYKGEIDDREFYLGCFSGGSANMYDYFYMDFKNNEYIATNMYSHLLMKLMIAYIRVKEPNGEVDTYFRRIDFNTKEKIIGANQKEQFFITADSLYYSSLNTFLNNSFDECDIEQFKTFVNNITKDITGFVCNTYQESYLSNAAKNLGISQEIPKIYPVEKKKKKSAKILLNEFKEKYYNGVQTFTKKELDEMPLLLKNGYQLAQTAFLANRDLWSLEEWTLVDALAIGDVKSINFTGPAGVGKTTTIRALAGALGMPFVLVGGSANIEECDLLGTRNVEAYDGVSITTWTDGPITMAIRYGAFLLFDEVNAADPGILMKLNTILDGSRSLILNTSEEVVVHPHFIYSEAMNVGAAYAGTDQMNQSHFDRMDEMFKISAKSPADEAKIISANTGYKNMINLQKMCEIKAFILRLIDQEGDASEQICSPRRMICWAKKAKRTGEFIDSSLSTVIAHLTVYDDSFDKLTKEAVIESGGIASSVIEKIIEEFSNVEY